MEPSDRFWSDFRSLHGLKDGCYQQTRPNSISVTKWNDTWLDLHKKCVDIEELLPFFWDTREYASGTSMKDHYDIIRAKQNDEISVPGECDRDNLVSFYEDCIRKCEKVPERAGEQLRGELRRNEHTLFWLPKYPWVTSTLLVNPVKASDRYVYIYCEILNDSSIWRWRDGRKIPKDAVLADIQTKVGSTLYLMSQGLAAHLFEAEIFLSGCGNLHRYTIQLQDIMSSIELRLNAAALLYNNKLKALTEADEKNLGEYWENGQDKNVIEKGTVVFNLHGRRHLQNSIGVVMSIDRHKGKARVKWNGTGQTSRKAISLENLHPVPVKQPNHPGSQQEGDVAVICGGFKRELYGKRVLIEKIRSKMVHVRLRSSRFKIEINHLHVDKVLGEPIIRKPCCAMYRVPTELVNTHAKMQHFIRQLPGEELTRLTYHYRRKNALSTEKSGSCQTTQYDSLPDANGAECDIVENEDGFLHEFEEFLMRKGQLVEIFSEVVERRHHYVKSGTVENLQDRTSWLGNSAMDLWIEWINAKFLNKGLHVVETELFSALYRTDNGEENPAYSNIQAQNNLFKKYSQRLDLGPGKLSMILIPVVYGGHWSLVVIGNPTDPQNVFALHADSMKSRRLRFRWSVYQRFLSHLNPENPDIHLEEVDCAPQQRDGWNCGPYTIYFMEALSTEFQKGDMTATGTSFVSRDSVIEVFNRLLSPESIISLIRETLLDMAMVAHREDELNISCNGCSFEIIHDSIDSQ